MTKDEALKLALEALEYRGGSTWLKHGVAVEAIKEALAQPAQGPTLQEQLAKANAGWVKADDEWRKATADREKAHDKWRKADAELNKATDDWRKADANWNKASADVKKATADWRKARADWHKAYAEVERLHQLIEEENND